MIIVFLNVSGIGGGEVEKDPFYHIPANKFNSFLHLDFNSRESLEILTAIHA